VTTDWQALKPSGFGDEKLYVVQTNPEIIARCVLMTTDVGDSVLDPTCGGGTTAYVAEQWGRRWITIDTSRVALALARARIMGAPSILPPGRFPRRSAQGFLSQRLRYTRPTRAWFASGGRLND
jgi:SAM-dependent methyltransferase